MPRSAAPPATDPAVPATAVALIAALGRAAVVRITEPGARFFLAAPHGYRLTGDGQTVVGVAERAVLVLSDLAPSTDYTLEIDGAAPLAFHTAPCAGFIDAADIATPGVDATAALQRAITFLPAGGTLRLGPGDWLSGPLFLKSDMTLHLAAGARLMAIPDRAQVPILPSHSGSGEARRVLGTWEGEPANCYAALITAIGCRNVRITGAGTIDGGGDRGDWWQWPKETRDGARRPRTIHLIDCADVVLAGPTVTNSPSWTVHPYACRDVAAYGLAIRNPADSPNTDGFNPESCTGVVIEGVHFSVGDDCIAIKAGKRGAGDNSHLAPTRDVAIRHCLMERGHGGVVLGSEMSGGIRDVTVEDCDMRQTDRGLRIKTRRGRGGEIRGVRFRRVSMDGVDAAITVNAFYFCDADGHAAWVQSRAPAPVSDTTPSISDFDIDDLTLTNLRLAVGVFLGLPEAPLKDIRVGRVDVHFDPAARPGIPEMADHLRPLVGAGLVAEYADIVLAADCGLTVTDGVSAPC